VPQAVNTTSYDANNRLWDRCDRLIDVLIDGVSFD
jgi:hypothetical protein